MSGESASVSSTVAITDDAASRGILSAVNGVPTEVPAPTPTLEVQSAKDAPVPPFGPIAASKIVVPIEEGVDPALAAGAPEGPADAPPQALTATPEGPSFNWSQTENYLVLGTDRRSKEGSWRTDSIMVVGLDRENNRAAVFSVPRDLYVDIPGYGWGRINQADFMGEQREPNGGGPKLVGDILLDVLGIPTSHWVRIQMDGFIRFIDAMGGVDVALDCAFSEPIFNLDTNRWEAFTLPAGTSHLDGQDAYWFARLRYRESDIGRSSRQRALIWALRDKVLSTNAVLRLPEIYAAFQDTISTDLSLLDMVGLAQLGISLDASNVRASGLTLYDLQNYTTPAGAQVLVIADPAHVRDVVDSVWSAPAMADAYRGANAHCPAVTTESAPVDNGEAGANGDATQFSDQPAAAPVVDPGTGYQLDPVTGWPLDPDTGQPINPATLPQAGG